MTLSWQQHCVSEPLSPSRRPQRVALECAAVLQYRPGTTIDSLLVLNLLTIYAHLVHLLVCWIRIMRLILIRFERKLRCLKVLFLPLMFYYIVMFCWRAGLNFTSVVPKQFIFLFELPIKYFLFVYFLTCISVGYKDVFDRYSSTLQLNLQK